MKRPFGITVIAIFALLRGLFGLCWPILAFMGSAEAQSILAKEMGRLTPHPDVDPALYTPMQQQAIEMIRDSDMVLQFYDRDTTPEMADEGMNAFMAFWDDPSLIDELLAELEKVRQEIFEGE